MEATIPAEIKAQLEQLGKNISRINELEGEIKKLTDGQKGSADLKEEVAKLSLKNAELIEAIEKVREDATKRADELDIEMQKRARDGGHQAGAELSAAFKAAIEEHKVGYDWRGRYDFETKAISNLEASGGPLLVPQYVPGVITPGRQELLIKQLLGGGNTASTAIIYFREKSRTNNAGYQEAQFDLKGESDIVWEQVTATVRDIAHWIYVSRQMLDDVPYLRGLVEGEMRYMLDYKEENEILNGAGGNAAMEGLNTAATAFDTTLMTGVQAPQQLDRIRKAMVQVGRTFFPATGVVLPAEGWADIELLKDGQDRYIFVQPQGTTVPRVWGIPVVSTYAQPDDTFLVANFIAAADYWQREATRVEVSTEDGDNFRRNRATLLVEKRGTTAIKRAQCLVKGSLSGEAATT